MLKPLLFGIMAVCYLGCGPEKQTQTDPVPNRPADVPDHISVRTKAGTKLATLPGAKAETVTELPAGLVLLATRAQGNFVFVKHEGQEGWVHASELQFQNDGPAFIEAWNAAIAKRESDRKRARQGGNQNPLKQCAHVHANGQQCLYQTADDSGYCPEHQ